MAGDDSATRRSRAASVVMSGVMRMSAMALPFSRCSWSMTLLPMRGMAVFSSNADVVAPIATAASRPTT